MNYKKKRWTLKKNKCTGQFTYGNFGESNLSVDEWS